VEEIDDQPRSAEEREIYLGTGEDLIKDTDLLRKSGLHINTRFHFVSCRLCGFILTGSWENHVQQHHAKAGQKNWVLTKEEKTEVGNLRGNTPTATDFHHGMEPVQGIAIFDGFACNHCDYCGKTEKSMRTHATAVRHTSAEFHPARLQRPYPTGKDNVNFRVGLFSLSSFFLPSSFPLYTLFFIIIILLIFFTLALLVFLFPGERHCREPRSGPTAS